jgi:hypothetical protein
LSSFFSKRYLPIWITFAKRHLSESRITEVVCDRVTTVGAQQKSMVSAALGFSFPTWKGGILICQ